ncbi:thermonuclease family protein [Methylobacterium organophilum]|uniref:thermonuclease family protein n=1 Tax=Methylobacterium organophilum TaxID=410 RepID=UPI001F133DD3|nr:thermonuclease family protein [Methylobacterium organophilum]UMY16015.1 thermonuclease family protein [Methylobacterium organophilum]
MKRVGWGSLGLVALALSGAAQAGETVTGKATVLEGDTLLVGGRVIGLYGLAAPGLQETCLNGKGLPYRCGLQSAQALEHHVRGATLHCQIVQGIDAAGRALSICHKDEEDLNAWMVSHGHAMAERTGDRPYATAELPAWARREGLWSGSFADPAERQRDSYTSLGAVAGIVTEGMRP